MVAAALLQFILFAIDDDSCDLLVHKNEDDTEQCREKGNQPPPEMIFKWTNEPTACTICVEQNAN